MSTSRSSTSTVKFQSCRTSTCVTPTPTPVTTVSSRSMRRKYRLWSNFSINLWEMRSCMGTLWGNWSMFGRLSTWNRRRSVCTCISTTDGTGKKWLSSLIRIGSCSRLKWARGASSWLNLVTVGSAWPKIHCILPACVVTFTASSAGATTSSVSCRRVVFSSGVWTKSHALRLRFCLVSWIQ